MLKKNFKAQDLKKGVQVMVEVSARKVEERTILSKDRKNGLATLNFTDGTWGYAALVESIVVEETV